MSKSDYRIKWKEAKGSLGADAQKALSKAKADLGPTLDKFVKALASLREELSAKGNSKKASQGLDDVVELSKSVESAADDYIKVLASFKADPAYKDAFATLRQLKHWLKEDVASIKNDYVDAAQKITEFTVAIVYGKDFEPTLNKITWFNNPVVKQFCTHAVIRLSAANLQPLQGLIAIQNDAEQNRADFQKYHTALTKICEKTYSSRKEVTSAVKKIFVPMAECARQMKPGVHGLITEWVVNQGILAKNYPGGADAWKKSLQGKAASQISDQAGATLKDQEAFLTDMESLVDKL
jgi:hypothetical protein